MCVLHTCARVYHLAKFQFSTPHHINSAESQAPLYFSCFVAAMIVSFVTSLFSLHYKNAPSSTFTVGELSGLCVLFVALWAVLAYLPVVRCGFLISCKMLKE